MAKVDLSAARLRELLHYDAATGLFSWVQRRHAHRKDAPVGSWKGKYRRVKIDGTAYPLHRLVWLFVHGKWPCGVVDHINGDPSDNRIENLRDVTVAANIQNQKKAHRDKESCGLLGVSRGRGGRWRARLVVNRKKISLGGYDTPELAYAAYVAAKRQLHEGCTI